MLTNSLKPTPRIRGFLETNCEMWGVRIVLALSEMPDRKIHCIALSHHLEPAENPAFSPAKVEFLINNADKIPMIDEQTLKAVDRELIRLIGIKAEKMKLKQNTSVQNREIKQLLKYRKQCTRPNGTIKHFNSVEQKEYQRHQAAIKRLMDKAKKECPEAFLYIRDHLLTGIWYFWSSEPIVHRRFLVVGSNSYVFPSQPKGHSRC